MASVLGVAPGSYAHHVGSLHIYEQHYDAAENLKYTTEPYESIPAITGFNWRQVQDRALSSLTAAMHIDEPMLLNSLHPFEGWYARAMITAIKKNEAKNV
jgi:hypothetical protein